jgi:error-prone DNA polymerase
VREDEARALVDEREQGGFFSSMADLASRAGVGRDGLERLAWAGTCASLGMDAGNGRRRDLWRVGIARPATAPPAQLSLPLSIPEPPPLRESSAWEEIVADYASTGMTLGEHPLALMRPALGDGLVTSEDLERRPDGSTVEVAGMVVARQRPATARGVVFMLLEDEVGVINLVVLPPVYQRDRLAVRTASFVRVVGKLERREGVTNVVVSSIAALATPGMQVAEVRPLEPGVERETGRARDHGGAEQLPGVAVAGAGLSGASGASREAGAADLAAVAPRPHSFGRR